VRCPVGAIFDVAVDLRRSLPSFGQWVGAELSAENQQQLWVPVGFAHGFLTLSEAAEVLYKASGYWSKTCERSLRWNDPDLAISLAAGSQLAWRRTPFGRQGCRSTQPWRRRWPPGRCLRERDGSGAAECPDQCRSCVPAAL
jgi:hypothetical protein